MIKKYYLYFKQIKHNLKSYKKFEIIFSILFFLISTVVYIQYSQADFQRAGGGGYGYGYGYGYAYGPPVIDIDHTPPVLGDLVYVKINGEVQNISPIGENYTVTINSSEYAQLADKLEGVIYVNVEGADTEAVFDVNWIEGEKSIGKLVYQTVGTVTNWFLVINENAEISFKTGKNTFQIILSDEAGNETWVIVDLVTVDIMPPEITLNGLPSVFMHRGNTYKDEGAVAFDDLDGDISDDIIVNSCGFLGAPMSDVDANNINDYCSCGGAGWSAGIGWTAYLIEYRVSDSSGNMAVPVLRRVKVLSVRENQVILSDNMNLSSSSKEILISNYSSMNSNIYIPSNVANAKLNVFAILDGASVVIPGSLNINSETSIGIINVQIPAGIEILGEFDWAMHEINLPRIRENSSVSVVPDAGNTAEVNSVIEIGFDDSLLTFNKGVRILIPNQAGRDIGYLSDEVFVPITSTCQEDIQTVGNNLSVGGDCKISVGDDLVVWTKHFTKFISYTQIAIPKPITTSTSGRSSGRSISVNYTPPITPIELPEVLPVPLKIEEIERVLVLGVEYNASNDVELIIQDTIRKEKEFIFEIDVNLSKRLSGRILLQVEEHGEAWYINPKDNKKYYMANGDKAYKIMKYLSVGITNKDLERVKADKDFAKKHSGKIFLQVEEHGEAYYIDVNANVHYLKNGNVAYDIMRNFGLGITNNDIRKIEVGEMY
ncbi:hypothetical protein KAI92_01345 [Candidatus Parcubacteria bacterium]|nr:hypothetical protein [Candidatus Parcubacteria bacterium]